MAPQRKAALMLPALILTAGASLPSTPDLGKAEGQCRPGESGPALLVSAAGLKDRSGTLKLEVYPASDADFLADDNLLVMAGKVFRRVEQPVPATGTPQLCVRLPGPGTYAVMLLHDRNANHRFNWREDGIGFAGNPRLGWSKPKAAAARTVAGAGLNRVSIVLNYHRGLGMAPLRQE